MSEPQDWAPYSSLEDAAKVYLRDPKAKVPGTKMSFPGLTHDSEIDNVIAYLQTFAPDGKPK